MRNQAVLVAVFFVAGCTGNRSLAAPTATSSAPAVTTTSSAAAASAGGARPISLDVMLDSYDVVETSRTKY